MAIGNHKRKELTAKELAFVSAFTTPPFPTIPEAAKAAGYSASHAYRLRYEPNIADAISEQLAMFADKQHDDTLQVLKNLAERAKSSDRAARIYLEAVGKIQHGAIHVTTNVQSGPDAFAGRLNRVFSERGVSRIPGVDDDGGVAVASGNGTSAKANGNGSGHADG